MTIREHGGSSTKLEIRSRASGVYTQTIACYKNTPLDVALPGSFDHVERNHRVVIHDHGVIGLDETHAAHVCCQVEYMINTFADLLAVVENPKVNENELVTEHVLLRT